MPDFDGDYVGSDRLALKGGETRAGRGMLRPQRGEGGGPAGEQP